jgi:N-methylhydantoinase A
VALLLSGPAAAVGALAYYGRAIGSNNLISMDIGGTSCDVIVIAKGAIEVTDQFQVAGYHLALPSIEVHSIGAGGGTIAGVDSAGMLFVGPNGAGANPGPAAYGLGGRDPTITDAQIVLGRLRPGPFAGGAVSLDARLAAEAIEKRLARPLGIGLESAAAGMLEVLEHRLLHAVQRLSTERGYDTREFTLVAAGGAGPLHAASVGRLLNCRRAYVPRLSGAFCALGMLHANVRHDLIRLHLQRLDESDASELSQIFRALEGDARKMLADGGFAESRMAFRYEMDLRYLGQQWDVRVAVEELPPDKRRVRASFESEYERRFGHHQPDGIIELSNLRVIGLGLLPSLGEATSALSGGQTRPYARRRVYLSRVDGWGVADIYRGRDLRPGHTCHGPLIVEEETTTLFAGPRDVLHVDASGNFGITLSSDTP